MRVLDGRPVARAIRKEVAAGVEALLRERGLRACLAAVLVGNDPASEVYVAGKQRDCERVGITSRLVRLPADCTRERLRATLDELSADPAVHGVLVQQPLPPQLDANEASALVHPGKDVDGLTPIQAGRLLRGEPGFVPCTPLGVMEILRFYEIPVAGKHAVVVGRSTLVGRPVSLLLLHANATVTICHSRTPDLGAMTRQADILVAATGKPGLIQPDMIRPGVAVIDVGITRAAGDQLLGDVDPKVGEIAELTPVPGGVGPMTRALLLRNTLEAARAWSSSGSR
ncbi:MAG TPA: bifunctional 5,10-methylenetetrahydrofolate dehydrogenase/5,10-methenyltetrahydrofolate cyclohydrolase [Bacillota bacterium]|nr:bifunctional 5,10-methylenetetrahydrofolate dehydrogenase/5,10-methenyltetrahydrofolate cyclohydrolase [Bacillota bacterium]